MYINGPFLKEATQKEQTKQELFIQVKRFLKKHIQMDI